MAGEALPWHLRSRGSLQTAESRVRSEMESGSIGRRTRILVRSWPQRSCWSEMGLKSVIRPQRGADRDRGTEEEEGEEHCLKEIHQSQLSLVRVVLLRGHPHGHFLPDLVPFLLISTQCRKKVLTRNIECDTVL